MKGIKIILIIIIAIVGAFLIYNHFDNINEDKEVLDKFTSEYTLVQEDHVFRTINIDGAITMLNNRTGIIFFCDPGSEWCQYFARLLDEVSRELNIENIYYLDINEDRSLNSTNYLKIVQILNDYLGTDDTGNKRINMPNITFVKDGVVVANDYETAIISSEITPDEYWNDENIIKFKNKIKQYIQLLSEEEMIVEEE